MKKTLALALAVVMAVSLAACGGGSSSGGNSGGGDSASSGGSGEIRNDLWGECKEDPSQQGKHSFEKRKHEG